jgi:hypothetical protein
LEVLALKMERARKARKPAPELDTSELVLEAVADIVVRAREARMMAPDQESESHDSDASKFAPPKTKVLFTLECNIIKRTVARKKKEILSAFQEKVKSTEC